MEMPGVIYGSIFNPISVGSGGADTVASGSKAGDGGGAVFLNISNALILGGVISFEGGDGIVTFGRGSGGGSGGSIYIVTDSISGSGNLSLKGVDVGDGVTDDGGGGSG